MTKEEKITFKNSLREFCQSHLKQRIEVAKTIIDNAQQSANNEEKSSAGDKYETARAMNHLEKEMYTRQLAENLKELSLLHNINTNVLYDTAVAGTVVQCNGLSFFIAAGLGKQVVNGQQIIFLSPHAPLAKALLLKKTGDELDFNKSRMLIEAIY